MWGEICILDVLEETCFVGKHKSKYEHKNVIFGYLSKLRRSSVLLGTVPSNPKVTGDRSPVSPVVVTRLLISHFSKKSHDDVTFA